MSGETNGCAISTTPGESARSFGFSYRLWALEHWEALLVSIGIVALAEVNDKTQLLTLVLAARYKKPWPIVAGISAATLAITRSRMP